MAGEDTKRAMHQALVDRVRNGAGRASAELRSRAFDNDDELPAPLRALLGTVVTSPTQVTDADFAAARAAGYGEDELFELVTCAAVGRSARLYDAGMAALADATRPPEAG